MLLLENLERTPHWLSACVMSASSLFVGVMVLRLMSIIMTLSAISKLIDAGV